MLARMFCLHAGTCEHACACTLRACTHVVHACMRNMCMHTCKHMCAHVQAHMCMCTHTCACTCVHMHLCMHMHTCACSRTCVRVHDNNIILLARLRACKPDRPASRLTGLLGLLASLLGLLAGL